MKYKQEYEGDWVTPIRKGYKMACCDCGLVHTLDFRVVIDQCKRPRIQFRAFRNNRATAGHRRGKK